MIEAHLPILQVIIPLLSAPLCLLMRNRTVVWSFALMANIITLLVSIFLLQQTLDSGVISYALGGWSAPIGIEYRVDILSAFILFIVSVISCVVLIYSGKSIGNEISEHRLPLFYTAYLLCLSGLLGIAITGDAFNLFVFLEISSLASYILISLGRDRRALTAAYQYLIMGTIGATFILIGVGLLYMMTGTLNMHDLAKRLPSVIETRTVHSAFAFLTVGICLKLALFPLHLWLPNAYAYAPSVVSAFLAATATKVAIYVLLRFTFTVFGVDFAFTDMPLGEILMIFAIAAIFIGSAVAIFQNNIKRMLAYSSIAQIGYIILGISFATSLGLTAGILHVFNHALMKGGLFLAMGAIVYQTGAINLRNFDGLGKTMPWTMAAIVVGGLSLVGVPLTTGFISKWYLVLAALEQGWWPVALVVLAGSILAFVYVWRLIEAAYFHAPGEHTGTVKEAPLMLLAPAWLLTGANIYFGINTDLSVGVASQAASILLGAQP